MVPNLKKTFWLFSLLIVLMVVVFGINYFRNFSEKQNSVFPKIIADQVNKIEIKNSNQTSIMEKKSGQWFVGDFKADESLVESFLSEIGKIEDSDLISNNPDKRKVFGVAEDSFQIKIYQNNYLVLDVFIGQFNPDQFGQYLRKNNEDNVYLARIDLSSFFTEDFRDKKIIKFNKDEISKIEWQYPNQSFNLAKDDKSEWKINSSKSVEEEKVSQFLTNLVNLTAIEIINNKTDEEAGFNKPQLKLIVSAGDKKIELLAGKEENNKIYLKISGEKNIYLIDKSSEEQLLKKNTDF